MQDQNQTRKQSRTTSDYNQVDKVLFNPEITKDLDDLNQMAYACSGPYKRGDKYVPCSDIYCDGVEFNLGPLNLQRAK